MSRKARIIICCILVVFAFGAGMIAYAQTQEGKTKTANAVGTPNYLVDKDGKIAFPEDPDDADLREEAMLNRGNSETNPFVVLEIVPYEGMAKFGYLIDGQEPLDVEAIARNNENVQDESSNYKVVDDSVTFKYWETEKPATLKNYNADSTMKIRQYGTMKYMPDAGKYDRTVDEKDGENVTKATYTLATDGKGDFAWTPLSVEESLAIAASSDEEKAPYETGYQNAVNEGDTFKMYFDNVQYVSRVGKKLVHKDTFLRESVGLAYKMVDGVRVKITDEDEINARVDNFHTKVITVTPEDLNLNPKLVDRADLIVISTPSDNIFYTYDDPANGISKSIYLKEGMFGYEIENDAARGNNKKDATFKTNLLNWEIALKIYDRATNPVRICPIIVDSELYSLTKGSNGDGLSMEVALTKKLADGTIADGAKRLGTQNNMAKLFLMMYQMTNPVFENFYGEVTATNHAFFEETDMLEKVNIDGTESLVPVVRKGVTLQTGVFKYDKDWTTGTVTEEESKVYWNDLTMYPWQIFPISAISMHDSANDYAKYAAMFGIMVDGAGTFENKLYEGDAQDSIRNGLMMFNGDTKMTSGFDSMFCGVKNNAFGAELYEFFDSINGPDGPPPDSNSPGNHLTTADCLYYLLNGLQPLDTYDKEYKILELQPSPVYESKEYFWEPLIANYTNATTEPVVEQMTTSEFIGSHVECISEYDIVYIGMNKSAADMTMKFPSGTTNFVYAHTGPKITVENPFPALYGWLTKPGETVKTDREKTFAFSGNDLTKLALTKLKEYDAAEHTILFDEDFYTDTGDIATTVDGNSNMYTLGKDVTNAFSMDGIINHAAVRGDFKNRLTLYSKKVTLVNVEKPILYDGNKTDDKEKYINGENNADRTLRFKFKINAPAGTTYNVKLYVDGNTDGIFKEGQEDVGATVYRVEGGSQYVHSGPLEAGKTYAVTRPVMDRIGSVVWKLDLVRDNKVYASLDGVSAIKAKEDGTEDKTIVVLQIEPKSADKVSLKLPKNQAEAEALGGVSELFYEKVKDINGMDLSFVRMQENEIKTKILHDGDYLYKNFDMLVLGFADTYDGVSDDLVLTKIQEFIDYGKAVLYTHDTSSGIGENETTDFPKWGEQVTLKYREMFGMDRYGALGFVNTGTVTSNKDIPYQPVAGSPQLTSIYKSTEDDRDLIQGVANGMLYRTLYPSMFAGSSYPGETYVGKTQTKHNQHDANVNTKKVSRVNRGAITEYPYSIDEEIVVAKTHPQYYQLDMEKEDIVVWYCLAEEGTGLTPDTGLDYQNAYFGITPNDVRNNYYIYNIGNVTYSGMGHMPYYTEPLDMQESVEEVELFVNTFVAAYRAAAKGVEVKVVNDDATSNAAGDQFLCVDVDSSDPDEIIGNDIEDKTRLQVPKTAPAVGFTQSGEINKKSKRVYFRLYDYNTYGDTEYSLKIVWNNGAEANGITIDGTSTQLAVYKKVGTNGEAFVNCDTEKFEANSDAHIYFVDVPIKVETVAGGNVVGKTDLTITVTMKYKIGSKEFTVEKDTKVSIMPRGLFNLD